MLFTRLEIKVESSSLNILSALIIESSALFQKKIKSMLEKAGIEIAGVLTSAENAVETMLSTNPNLIILDILMFNIFLIKQIFDDMDLES